jgi:hypothetical protein
MAGRALSSFTLLALLTAATSVARADDPQQQIAVGEPSPQAQRQAEPQPPPKLLGFGKGEDGTHAFLFARREAPPVVILGQPGQLEELEVLGIERYPGKFVVDTLELGTIEFRRGAHDNGVIIPGEIGFNAKHPTRTLRGTPDREVFAEAMSKMGFVRRAPSPAQTLPTTGAGVETRARGSRLTSTVAGDRMGPVNMMKKTAKARMKARTFRRPVAKSRVRMTARTRQGASARATGAAH